MLKNYLRIALRNLMKHKIYSFINIFALGLSLSFCLLIIVLIKDQNSFDRFHSRSSDIYRVLTDTQRKDGSTEKYASSPRPLGSVIANESPAVENVVQLSRTFSSEIRYQTLNLSVSGVFTDPSFFNVFGFQLAEGDPGSALKEPNSIVLADETSRKIFGMESPLGRSISFINYGDFVVTGVLKPLPGKTHLEFETLVSASTLPALEKTKKIEPILESWTNYYATYTYVRLREGHIGGELQSLLAAIPEKYYGNLEIESRDQSYRFELQRLDQITPGILLSNSIGKGMPEVLLIFLGVLAMLGLIAAVFNYTNLTLARVLTRAKEIGIRKVIGASRYQIFLQFVGESVLIVFFAFLVAETLLRIVLIPQFMNLQLNRSLDVTFVFDVWTYLSFITFILTVGVIAGLLPSAVISKFKPVSVLKDVSKMRILPKITLRRALIVFQFALSLVLIIAVTTIYDQIQYVLNMDYGFSSDNIVGIELQGNPHEVAATEMAMVPGVIDYALASHNIGTWEDADIDVRTNAETEPLGVRFYSVDSRYVNHFGLSLIAGENFETGDSPHNQNSVIVNEMFLEKFQLGNVHDAIGKIILIGDKAEMRIAGVLKDFIFKPATYQMEPLLLRYDPASFRILYLKINSQNITETVEKLETTWKKLDKVHSFTFKCFDDLIEETYSLFKDIMLIVGFLSILAFTIAMLGLLGIVTFNAETRVKEIGIRKVLGAGPWHIIVLLARNDFFLQVIASLIAIPISLLLAGQILQSFAYRIDAGIGTILPGMLAVFLTGGVIVVVQALRSAHANPVEALKYE